MIASNDKYLYFTSTIIFSLLIFLILKSTKLMTCTMSQNNAMNYELFCLATPMNWKLSALWLKFTKLNKVYSLHLKD